MAITEADLDRLKAALASGERVIQTRDGRRVEYRSIDEIKDAIQAVEEQLSNETPAPRVLRGFAYHKSGL